MESSSSASRGNGQALQRHGGIEPRRCPITGKVLCFCGLIAGQWTSWTLPNPGRRFWGCKHYQNEAIRCRFFEWVDPELELFFYKRKLYDLHQALLSSNRGEAQRLRNEDLLRHKEEELSRQDDLLRQKEGEIVRQADLLKLKEDELLKQRDLVTLHEQEVKMVKKEAMIWRRSAWVLLGVLLIVCWCMMGRSG